jgi:hypothetical protein
VPEVSKAGRRNRPHVPAPHDPYPETLAHHNLSTLYARDVRLFLGAPLGSGRPSATSPCRCRSSGR